MSLVRFKNHYPATGTPFTTLFNDFFNGGLNDLMHREFTTSQVPAVNLSETTNAFRVEVAAPGYSKENFALSLNNNVLTISGRKEDKAEEGEKERYTRREWHYNQFERSFTLPNSIATDAISATYVDGVLNITLPKRDEAKEKPVRSISIN